MNRTFLAAIEALGAPDGLLLDSAIKGTVPLAAAVVAAMLLRRDSAATRHLVWMLAIAAMLAIPAFSALLPRWRALPGWAGIPANAAAAGAKSPVAVPPESPPPSRSAGQAPPTATDYRRPAAGRQASRPAPVARAIVPESPNRRVGWADGLAFVWAIGFSALILRLIVARWMLRASERRATVMWPSGRPAPTAHDPIMSAVDDAMSRLGLRHPLLVSIHPDGAIPAVWGIFRPRLMLPSAARRWDAAQLRSVLLHELAHVRRRDTMAQLLAQVACAVHWFNPLVWFAAWRLGVERERACDDMVLASGVRPSAYAGHLLDVVTGLSPARRTRSCGLAMARESSLEGRLVAVLGEGHSRRGVSTAFAAIATAIGVGIAVPVSMLHAAEGEAGAPVQQGPAGPGGAAKLQPGTEERLQWGEPVSGLRLALAWPPTLGEPAAGEVPDLFLAVQNVSEAPVRLCTTADAPNVRGLNFSTNGVLQARIGSQGPNGVDATLKPREVVFLRLFTEGAKDTEKVPHGARFASEVSQSPEMTLRADLEITKAPAGAWTGKLVTPQTRAGIGADAPRNRKSQELFKVWLRHARVNGKIPGGCIARLGVRVGEFVRVNLADKAGEPYARRMEPLLSRLDGARDWQPAEASALLADIAAVSDAPLSVVLEENAGETIQYGPPLRKELEDAPWGEALPNGLRVACLLEPRAAAYRPGTALRMRIVVHNAGKEPVVFRSRSWHHIEPTARDAKGAEIGVESITRYTRAPLVAYRVVPGGSVELASPGIGIGRYGFHDFKDADIGSWLGVKGGEEVIMTPGPVPLGDWNEAAVINGEPRWWRDFLAARLSLATPLPASAAERTALLEREVWAVFGMAPTAEETAAFVADRGPDALDSLASRLAHRAGITPFTGSLTSGPTRFRVLPAGPDPATSPRPASSRGR